MDGGPPTAAAARPSPTLPHLSQRPIPGPPRLHTRCPPCAISAPTVRVFPTYHRSRLPRRLLRPLPPHRRRHHRLPPLRSPIYPLTRPPRLRFLLGSSRGPPRYFFRYPPTHNPPGSLPPP